MKLQTSPPPYSVYCPLGVLPSYKSKGEGRARPASGTVVERQVGDEYSAEIRARKMYSTIYYLAI